MIIINHSGNTIDGEHTLYVDTVHVLSKYSRSMLSLDKSACKKKNQTNILKTSWVRLRQFKL